jgi:uncharacterized protein YdhG (YjbR/CyaY superfamily)
MTVDEYLEAAPEPHRSTLGHVPALGSVLSELADELEPYEWSKGTLEFPVDKPLRHDLVARLGAVRMEQLGLR